MTSQINTNGINTNYPVPGENNSSQGFRDNFAQIRNNLNITSGEITDLQNKAVLKAALDNSVLDNNMANTLISNCATRGFRASTYNLGNALSGTVLINVNGGDVQYGTVTENVTLQFGNWAPTNTQSNVTLKLVIANLDASISLPSECVSSNNNFGVTLLENYANIANVATLTAPASVDTLEYTFSSIDCGNTIMVQPVNRAYQSTQIIKRDPSPCGAPGDMNGHVAIGNSVSQITISNTLTTGNYVIADNTSDLYVDIPITFTGTAFGNIVSGTTYYVNEIANATAFSVATEVGGSDVDLSDASGTMYGNPGAYVYVATGSYDAVEYAKFATNTTASTNLITLNNTSNVTVNAPITFTGNVFGGLVEDRVYYVKSVSSPNITISQTRVNGVAGSVVTLTTANGNCVATTQVGKDIWRRIEAKPW